MVAGPYNGKYRLWPETDNHQYGGGRVGPTPGLLLSVNSLETLVPVSFAYAIIKHQVIPVSLIVRRSIQYLLAKNALRVLLLLPVAGLVLSVALDPQRSVADVLLRNSTYFYALAVAAIALGLVFRRRLNEWVDRKFFREQYDREKILRGLVDDVKGLDSMAEMSRRVSEEVERAIHPESVHLFYRGGERGELSLTYTSGGAGSALQELRIPEDSQLLRLLELQGGAQDFPFPPKTKLPQGEKDWLASLGTRLIVPLAGTDEHLTGLFLLGGKKSEVPYTARDRELLESVAAQIAIVYENVRLKESAREDKRVRHEVLSRFEGRGVNLLKECPRCGLCYDSTSSRCDSDGAELQLTLPVERTIEGRTLLELPNSMERDEFALEDERPEAARLVEVIRRALAKAPAQRFQSAGEMRRELVAALKSCPPTAEPALDADTVMLPKGK